ncbi:MazG-like family protein, partial [Vallitalea sediminicola]
IYKGDFDITKTIRIIERLKSQLLSNVSALFSNMAEGNTGGNNENIDILADIIILSYLLSDRLGVSNEALDVKLI